MIQIVSTLPHLWSIVPLLPHYATHTAGYIHVIGVSTVLSILYHATEESNLLLTILDYACAGVWGLYDLYLGYTYTSPETLLTIVGLNAASFLFNQLLPEMHSLWHLLNASKSYWVSSAIAAALV